MISGVRVCVSRVTLCDSIKTKSVYVQEKKRNHYPDNRPTGR